MSDYLQKKGVDALAQKLDELITLVSKKAPGVLLEKARNQELIIKKGLPDYLKAQYHKCETIRTLLKRDAPTILETVYVPHRFKQNKVEKSESDIYIDIGQKLQRTIISGRAGSGKSVFFEEAVSCVSRERGNLLSDISGTANARRREQRNPPRRDIQVN